MLGRFVEREFLAGERRARGDALENFVVIFRYEDT